MNDRSTVPHSASAGLTFNASSIENILGFPFTDRNYVELLVSGKGIFQQIIDCISSARHIICIEFYIFKDDDTGKKVAELLKQKAQQGVKVYLLYDHFGSFLTSTGFWRDLRKSGIELKVANPFRWSSPGMYLYRNHKKLLLIDGVTAILGGFNIADEYYHAFRRKKRVWRDTGILLRGPAVSTLMNLFYKSWTTWQGKAFMHNVHEKKYSTPHGVTVIPVFSNNGKARRKMRRLLEYSIKNAQDCILLTTAYFVPTRRITRALINAANRGVNIRLLLPEESDVKSILYAGRSTYVKLMRSGVEIFLYHGSVLHAKTAVFDTCWSIIGSTNLDFQSLRRNEESNIGILNSDFSGQMVHAFQDDLRNSIKIDLETWAHRPLYQKFLEKFFSAIIKRL
jgi:cardiolipin synthase